MPTLNSRFSATAIVFWICHLIVVSGLHAATVTIRTTAEPTEGGTVTGGGTMEQNSAERPIIGIAASTGWYIAEIQFLPVASGFPTDPLFVSLVAELLGNTPIVEFSGQVRPDRDKTVWVRFGRIKPSIVEEPRDMILDENGGFLSAVTEGFSAVGNQPNRLAYQWFKNGSPLPDAVDSSVGFFNNPSRFDAGQYFLKVSNGFGAATSRVATVTWWQDALQPAPLPSRPLVYTGYYGYTNTPAYTFAEGEFIQLETRLQERVDDAKFQWFRDGVPIGDGKAQYEFGPLTFRDAGAYTVRSWTAAGTNDSPAVIVTIPPRLKRHALLGGEWAEIGTNSVYFAESTSIRFETSVSPGLIFYTLDGSEPSLSSTLYSDAFAVTNSCLVRAVVFTPDFTYSAAFVEFTLVKSEAGTLEFAHTLGGWFVVESRQPYVVGSTIKVRPVVAGGAYESSKFLGWTGTTVSTQELLSFTMERHVFVLPLFGTAATVAALGSGEILGLKSGELVPYGNVLHLTALPRPGSRFVQWGGTGTGTNAHLSFTNIGPNLVVTALFTPLSQNEVTLTTKTEGIGHIRMEPPGNSYPKGTSVTARAVPGLHQSFLGWSGAVTGTDAEMTISLTESTTIEARFTEHLVLRPSIGFQTGFRLEVSGGPRRAFRVEESSDFQTWGTPIHVPALPGDVVIPRWWNLEPTYFRAVRE